MNDVQVNEEHYDALAQLQKKRPKIRVFRLFFAIVSLGLLITYFVHPATSRINHVDVVGNTYVTDDEVMKAMGLYEYPNFYFYFPMFHKNKLTDDFRIDKVEVSKGLFRKITINVTESLPFVYSSFSGRMYYDNLNQLEVESNLYGCPILVNEVKDEFIYKLVLELSELPREVYDVISEIEYAPTTVDEQRFRFYMNDGNIAYITLLTFAEKLKYYHEMAVQTNGQKGIFYLDVGATFNPYPN